MDPKALMQFSKFLSFVLRHQPQSIGLVLDPHGWAEIDCLLAQSQAHGRKPSREIIETVVATNSKQRFAISEDGRFIRANQGHSTNVDLGYRPTLPPETLFHGTISSALASIRARGLQKMARHHVHLSADAETARAVGMRRGKPVLLRSSAVRMHDAGHVFFVSANGVWLTDRVPPEYIEFQEP